MKFKEIELKYDAKNLPLTEFRAFCESRNPTKFFIASGWDYFFSNTEDPDAFCRHRVGPDSNTLTFKRKLTDSNNFIRNEHNLDLTKKMTLEQVVALCAEFGYQPNTSIFKNCFIYNYEDHILVYYVVYNEEMSEICRFVEIEAREDYGWTSEKEAWDSIVAIERIAKYKLGITPQARMKKSLYEIVRKEV